MANVNPSQSQPTPSSSIPIPTPRPPAVPQRTPSMSRSLSGSLPTRHPHPPSNVAELHQELEREQEGVVNRLLNQITRVAQDVASHHPGTNTDDIVTAAAEATSTTAPTAPGHHHHGHVPPPLPLSASPQLSAPIHSPLHRHHPSTSSHHSTHPPSVTDMPSSFSPAIGRSRSPAPSLHHHTHHGSRGPGESGGREHTSHSRHNSLSTRSRTSSRTSSPLLLPQGMESSVWPATANDPFLMGGRDEVAFYKVETDMLLRENEMLKRRIKELEDKTAAASRPASEAASSSAKAGDDDAVSPKAI